MSLNGFQQLEKKLNLNGIKINQSDQCCTGYKKLKIKIKSYVIMGKFCVNKLIM